MSKLFKYDDFLVYNEATGTYYMAEDQKVRDQTEKNHWKGTGIAVLKDWRLYIMLVPMLLVYLLWRYMPMYELVACFKNASSATLVADQEWYGLTNFDTLFFNPMYAGPFWQAFRNTFVTSFYGLVFGFPFPIILALFFNEIRSNITRSILQVCVYLPKFLSTVIVTTLIISLFRGRSDVADYGIISKGLVAIFGENSAVAEFAPQGLAQSTRYFRAIFVFSGLWEHGGYDSIVFFAAVIAVSPTSYEAAQIDGAGKMAQMRYVVLPSILSTVVIMLIMKIGSLLSVGFEKVYLFCPNQQSGNYAVANVVSTLANEWQKLSVEAGQIGIAAEMVNNLIGMILVIGANAISRKASDVSLY